MALLGTLLAGAAPAANAVVPGKNGKIAFSSVRDGKNQNIYVMNADGSGQTRLTNGRIDDYPTWSPDGKKIAFDGVDTMYVMNADGSGQTRLTRSTPSGINPAWSPDGKKIAFTHVSVPDFNAEIYVMNADGSGLTRLTRNALGPGGGGDYSPDWSPDGRKIAFASGRQRPAGCSVCLDVYVMNADGSGQTRLTNNAATDQDPAWSPDGKKIAFTSGRDGGGGLAVYVMNANGSGQTRLTRPTYGAYQVHPAWSPDGKKIAFTSDRDGGLDVYVMNANGSGQTRLTYNAGWDGSPAWQPVPAATPPPRPSSPMAAVGMPFTGKWAYNASVKPPYTDANSSHPSVHHRYYGDWATDLYAAAGTQVKLHVTSKDGTVSFRFNRWHDSCSSAGKNVAGTGVVLNVLADGEVVGSIDFEHLDRISTGPYRNGMTLGYLTSEPLAGAPSYCYTARHVHIEVKNSGKGAHSCWVDHASPGVRLREAEAIGVLGSANKATRQACRSMP